MSARLYNAMIAVVNFQARRVLRAHDDTLILNDMDQDLRRYIEDAIFDQASIRHVQSMLPDDAELDRWLAETAADYAANEFVFLTVAALAQGRRLDAQHLAKGAAILDAADILLETATKFAGNVAEYLMQAVQNSVMSHRGRAWALGIIAVLHEESGNPVPPQVQAITRSIARFPDLQPESLPAFHGLAMYFKDGELLGFLRRRHYRGVSEQRWRAMCENARTFPAEIVKMRATPVMDVVPQKGSRILAMGSTTVRRAVPRIGRNEPCHCGSGKKYKHCCSTKDQERLRHSSEVEGMTEAERDAWPETFLTDARLKTMSITEVLALDPDRVPLELYEAYLTRLAQCKEFDRAAEAVEKIGYGDDLLQIWHSLVGTAAFLGRTAAARRLIELRLAARVPHDDLETMYRLLPIEDDPAKSLEWLDTEALSALKSGNVDELRGIAYALLLTKHQALGVLLCRGVIPLLSSPADASSMLDYVMQARERLHLDPDEPISDVVDTLWTANEEALDTDNELRQTRELFELKRREAAEIKESRDRLQREIKRLTEDASARASAAEAAAAAEPEVVRDLRRKLRNTEEELKERNAERNSARRDLQQKQSELDTLRKQSENAARDMPTDSDTRAEEELLLPQESDIHQPLRILEFPRNFEQRLNAFPRNVARAALATLGRLAGGEPAAFVGAVRLKACPSVTRQRVGGDYRLLFRLLPDRIQVIDLIPRNELERRVRILASQYD